jgi:predicted TIM-barrel fold metal-dependent hydrolase
MDRRAFCAAISAGVVAAMMPTVAAAAPPQPLRFAHFMTRTTAFNGDSKKAAVDYFVESLRKYMQREGMTRVIHVETSEDWDSEQQIYSIRHTVGLI